MQQRSRLYPSVSSRRRVPHALAALCLCTLLAGVGACDRETQVAGVGLELQKPETWTYVSATPVTARGQHVRFDATQVAQALAGGTADPMFVLLKHPHPYAGTNPTFGVNISRIENAAARVAGDAAGDVNPAAHLGHLIEQAQTSTGKTFETLSPVTPFTLAGLPAARAILRGSPGPGDSAGAVRLTIVVAVAQDTRFMIASSSPEQGADEASAEFERIMASIRFPVAE